MHCVIETPDFGKSAKAEGLSADDRHKLTTFISDNPKAGVLIQGTGGARKLRFRKEGSGKSGGYRVITYFAAEDIPVFLLDIYSKGQKLNLSDAEKKEMKSILGGIAKDYRQSMKEKVSELAEKAS